MAGAGLGSQPRGGRDAGTLTPSRLSLSRWGKLGRRVALGGESWGVGPGVPHRDPELSPRLAARLPVSARRWSPELLWATPPRAKRTPQLREPARRPGVARRVRTRVSPDSPEAVRTRLRHAPFPEAVVAQSRTSRPGRQEEPLRRGTPRGRVTTLLFPTSPPASPQPRAERRCGRPGRGRPRPG